MKAADEVAGAGATVMDQLDIVINLIFRLLRHAVADMFAEHHRRVEIDHCVSV